MRLYNRPRRRPAPIGYFAQTVDPIDEMLAEPPSVEVFVSLIYMSVVRAKEAAVFVGDGNFVAAKMAIQSEYPVGVPNPKGAFGLWNYAGKMLMDLYQKGRITEALFDNLSFSLKIPALTIIQEADSVVKTQSDSAWARMWSTGFTAFDTKADAFLKGQADKYVRLYRGIAARNASTAALIDTIKRNAAALPNTVQTLPILEKDLNTGRTAQSAIETAFAETEITPAMLRGEQALGDAKTEAAKLGIKKLSKWLGPALAKLGLSAAKSKWITKIIYWTGKPLVWIIVKGAKYSTMLAGTYVVAWMFSKGSEDYAHFGGNPLTLLAAVIGRAKKDKETAAKKGDKPAEKKADEVIAGAESAEQQGKAVVKSAKEDFPDEAALYATDGGDTAWALYALGGGALVIGLYLYFSRKSQTETQTES